MASSPWVECFQYDAQNRLWEWVYNDFERKEVGTVDCMFKNFHKTLYKFFQETDGIDTEARKTKRKRWRNFEIVWRNRLLINVLMDEVKQNDEQFEVDQQKHPKLKIISSRTYEMEYGESQVVPQSVLNFEMRFNKELQQYRLYQRIPTHDVDESGRVLSGADIAYWTMKTIEPLMFRIRPTGALQNDFDFERLEAANGKTLFTGRFNHSVIIATPPPKNTNKIIDEEQALFKTPGSIEPFNTLSKRLTQMDYEALIPLDEHERPPYAEYWWVLEKSKPVQRNAKASSPQRNRKNKKVTRGVRRIDLDKTFRETIKDQENFVLFNQGSKVTFQKRVQRGDGNCFYYCFIDFLKDRHSDYKKLFKNSFLDNDPDKRHVAENIIAKCFGSENNTSLVQQIKNLVVDYYNENKKEIGSKACPHDLSTTNMEKHRELYEWSDEDIICVVQFIFQNLNIFVLSKDDDGKIEFGLSLKSRSDTRDSMNFCLMNHRHRGNGYHFDRLKLIQGDPFSLVTDTFGNSGGESTQSASASPTTRDAANIVSSLGLSEVEDYVNQLCFGKGAETGKLPDLPQDIISLRDSGDLSTIARLGQLSMHRDRLSIEMMLQHPKEQRYHVTWERASRTEPFQHVRIQNLGTLNFHFRGRDHNVQVQNPAADQPGTIVYDQGRIDIPIGERIVYGFAKGKVLYFIARNETKRGKTSLIRVEMIQRQKDANLKLIDKKEIECDFRRGGIISAQVLGPWLVLCFMNHTTIYFDCFWTGLTKGQSLGRQGLVMAGAGAGAGASPDPDLLDPAQVPCFKTYTFKQPRVLGFDLMQVKHSGAQLVVVLRDRIKFFGLLTAAETSVPTRAHGSQSILVQQCNKTRNPQIACLGCHSNHKSGLIQDISMNESGQTPKLIDLYRLAQLAQNENSVGPIRGICSEQYIYLIQLELRTKGLDREHSYATFSTARLKKQILNPNPKAKK